MAAKILLDTDAALDHLADRQPFADYAHRLFALAETGELAVCLSSLSVDTHRGHLYARLVSPVLARPVHLKNRNA